MRNYYSFVIIVFILMISCGKADKQLKNPENNPKTADSLTSGIYREFYSNGKIKTESEAKGKLRHGLTKNFDRNGKLLSQVNYINNVPDGMATNFYAESGKINSTFVYKNGIKEGDEIWYYENGQPYRVTPYVKGRAEGIQKLYYEDGKILAEVPFKEGFPGKGLKEYNKDGSLIKNYPQLVIKQKDYLKTANKVILYIELSENNYQSKFYRGQLDGDKYLNKKQLLLAMQNGISQIDFNVAPGSAFRQKVIISANIKTRLGNPLVISKDFVVNAINN